jgi:hypothetical protein
MSNAALTMLTMINTDLERVFMAVYLHACIASAMHAFFVSGLVSK